MIITPTLSLLRCRLIDLVESEDDRAYQISQRIQFLPHQTALPPPARDFPIEEIEEQSQWHESEGDVEVGGGGGGAEAVAHGGEDGGEAAEAVEEGDAVGEVVGADEGEVAGVGVVEEADLLVLFWEGGGRS